VGSEMCIRDRLLCDYSPSLFDNGITRPLDHIPTLRIALGLEAGTTSTRHGCVSQNELREAIERIIGVDKVYPPSTAMVRDNVLQRVSETFDDLLGVIGRTLEMKLKDAINPITSFRDVDEGVNFGSTDSATIVQRLRAR